MTTDPLATFRRLLTPPSALGTEDDADAKVRAAVELMRRTRMNQREAEARHLAGTMREGIPTEDDILRRNEFWLLAVYASFLEERAAYTDDVQLLRDTLTRHGEVIAAARRLLLREPEIVGAFVPLATAGDRFGTPTGTRHRSTGTGNRRSGTGRKGSGTRSGTKHTTRRTWG